MRMIDTMVMVHGLSPKRANETQVLRTKRLAAKACLLSGDEIVISAITYVEFFGTIRPHESEKLKTIRDRIRVIAFDVAASERAAEWVRKLRARISVCKACLGPKKKNHHAPCKKCGACLGRPARLNDLFIAATADTNPEIDVLYSYDGGILSLRDVVSGVEIREPPSADGPIFEDAKVLSIVSESD